MYLTLLCRCLLLNLLNLSLPLSVQPHLGCCAWWNTHTMTLLDHCLYNFTVFFLLDIFVYIFYYEYFAYFHRKKAKLLSHYLV